MPMYTLIQYSDNCSDTSWWFKRDKIIWNINLTNNSSSSFEYKSNLIGNTDADGANRKKGAKIVMPLKYLSNFWRSWEMPLINFKVELSLRWSENCVLSNVAGNSTFEITHTKLYQLYQLYQNYWLKDLKDQFIGMNIQ